MRHSGEAAHRAIVKHDGQSEQFIDHAPVSNYTCFGQIPAIFVTKGALIGAADAGSILEHGESNMLHRAAPAGIIGRHNRTIGEASPLPDAGYIIG